jgi:hypothetical protein
MSHTLGPWRIRHNGTHDGDRTITSATRDIVRLDGGINDDSETCANARLIAAAPELLEACKNVVWKLSHGGDKGKGFEMNTIDLKDAVVRLCETAIAKAEGK